MTLSRTQQKLIDLARRYGGRYSVDTCAGRGPCGGRRNYGSRDRDAMFALERAGLIRIVARELWTDYNNGYGMSGNSFVYELI